MKRTKELANAISPGSVRYSANVAKLRVDWEIKVDLEIIGVFFSLFGFRVIDKRNMLVR